MKLRLGHLIPALIATVVMLMVSGIHLLPRVAPTLNFFQQIEWITYDWRMKVSINSSHLPVSPNLGAVFIDDDTLTFVNTNKALGFTWPFPRQLYGLVTRELTAQGAKAVAFDVLFAELHRPSAETRVQTTNGWRHSDAFFSEQLLAASNVVLATMGDFQKVNGLREWRALPPNPFFATNAWKLGHITSEADSDGVLRKARLWQDDPVMGRIWAMGVVLAARQLELDLDRARIEPRRVIIPGKRSTVSIPIDEDGFFYINWMLTWNDKRIAKESFENMLIYDAYRQAGHGDQLDSLYKNKLVVVGSIGSGNNVADSGATPISQHTYLMSKHWNVANSILTGHYIERSPFYLDIMLIIMMGAISAFFTWRLRALHASIWVLFATLLYIAFATLMFKLRLFWMPVALPVLGSLLMTHVCMVSYRVVFEESERRRVRAVFSRVVSPDVVSELLNAEKISLGGARRRVTVFFADVRGFTELSDRHQAKAEEEVQRLKLTGPAADAYYDESARELLATINLYLSTIADTIKTHQGTLDKYIGDCVMAFWGAPIHNPRHAVACVEAAIEAQRAMARLNLEREKENQVRAEENVSLLAQGKPPRPILPILAFGSGINTGPAIVGMMGSEGHIANYTVFGREVNLASRLEGISGRSRIIIGLGTFQDIQRDDTALAASCVELEPVAVKGFKELVRIFEVPWKADPATVKESAENALAGQP